MKSVKPSKATGCTSKILDSTTNRRSFLKGLSVAAAASSAALTTGCIPSADAAGSEEMKLRWQEFFKKNYRLMTQEEKDATIARLERLAKLQKNLDIQMSNDAPLEGVLYGYAFNITRCEGFMECVSACVKENNLDRKTNTQYISEVKENDEVDIMLTFFDHDKKRLHLKLEMIEKKTQKLSATMEWISLYIDLDIRKVTEFENEKIKIMNEFIEKNKVSFISDDLKFSSKLKK